MTDDHQQWSLRLIAYHDDELPHAERERLHAHLASCPYCQRTLQELTRLRELLHHAHPVPWSAIKPPAEMWHQLQRQLPHRPRTAAPLPSWLRWVPSAGFLFSNLITQAAGVLLLVVSLLTALGLVDARKLVSPFDEIRIVRANQVLEWMTLRALSGVLGWGASVISVPPEWEAVAGVLFSMALFGLLAGVLGVGYILSLWLLWHRGHLSRHDQAEADYGPR